MNQPIDIVIPWVDDRDEAWRKEYRESLRRYCPEVKSVSNIRFESWDNLHYWFRALEKFMPWINKVVFVTWGHLPSFLRTDHPKLKIVRHEDYIPQEYLPTYNSNSIEMNYHRIKELSENFVIFNDDMIPLQPIPETYYFSEDKVCDEAVEGAICPAEVGPIANMARYTQVNNMIIINRHFKKREVQEKNPGVWSSEAYGELMERNKSMSYWYDFSGFHDPHMPSAMKKSTLKKLWEVEPETLDAGSRNHFRTYTDVTQYLIRYWQLCEGNIVPRRTLGKMCIVNKDNASYYAEGIARQEWQMVSLNEDCTPEEFQGIKEKINKALHSILPDKSSFEK